MDVLLAWRKPARMNRALTTLALMLVCSIGASAQTPPTPTTPAAPAARVPFPNRANEVLPAWLRVRGEFRERFEGFTGGNFVEGRDDAYGLSRFRFNASIIPSSTLSFQVQAQDARVAKKELAPTRGVPVRGTFDLRMAFADVGSAKSPMAARLGRQELAFGEQRLVGHVSWLNTARTFDGARVTWKSKPVQVEAFGASVVRIMEDEFDKSGNGNKFFGAYATAGTLIPKGSLEPYVFYKGDRNIRNERGVLADLGVTTLGARWAGRLPARLDYGIEMAAQTGSLGADDMSTWAGHWQLRESLPGPGAVRLSGEYNFASGDEDPADGKRGTFDHLYPTPHDKYGLADQVGWRNIHHLRTTIETTPWKKWQLIGGYNSWWLDEKRDGLYNAGGTQIARVAAGAASSHVGQELDIQAARALTPQLQLSAGYAHIFPGKFLQQATPGASYNYPYVMATYVFLADK